MAKKIKLSADTNKRAKSIVDALTSEDKEAEQSQDDLIKAAAVAMGSKGGLKGGLARSAALSPKNVLQLQRKLLLRNRGIKRINPLIQVFHQSI